MNSSDFIEFGVGISLGGVMAREIGNSFANGIDAHTSMNVLTVPQTRAEIQNLLDKLDVRLANGEISEELYKNLVNKWQARLANLP